MHQHIKILAILFLILGALGVLIAIGIVIAGAGFVAAILSQAGSGDEQAVAGIVGTCATALAVFFGILSVPTLAAGWGLLKHKSWSRVLGIIVSILSLTHVPLGTAIGVYGLWVLFNDETKRILIQ